MAWSDHDLFGYSPPIEYRPKIKTYECDVCGKIFEVDINKCFASHIRYKRDGWTKLPYDPPYNNPTIYKYLCDDCAKKVAEYLLSVGYAESHETQCNLCGEKIPHWWYVNMREVTMIHLSNIEPFITKYDPYACQKCTANLFDFIEKLKEENK